MSILDTDHYGLFLSFCERRAEDEDVHWMIVLAHPGADQCVRLHCDGEPNHRQFLLQAETPFKWTENCEYRNIKIHKLINRIPTGAFHTVVEEAKATPLQSSVFWALYLLFRLERKGLIPEGSYAHWMSYNLVENENTEDDEDQGPGNLWSEVAENERRKDIKDQRSGNLLVRVR